MPLVSKAFGDIITFTRASTATYFDATGTLQSAAINVPRFDYDPDTLAARGFLIEEARTNSQLYSEDLSNAGGWTVSFATISTNAIAAPTGAVTADKLVEDSSTSAHQISSINAVTAGVAYTFSFFVKPAERTKLVVSGMGLAGAGLTPVFTLSGAGSVAGGPTGTTITAINNGWYRCFIPYTPTNTTPPIYLLDNGSGTSYTGDGTSGLYIWGAQIEVGAFPTSYIPTTTTALTRSADVASVNTLSPWFNATEGTIFCQGLTPPELANFPSIGPALSDGTTSNRIIQYVFTNGFYGSATTSGASQGNTSILTTPTIGAQYKFATAYANNDSQSALNGTASTVDNTYTVPTVNQMRINTNGTVSGNLPNSWVQRITYYPRRLSNAELQSITA